MPHVRSKSSGIWGRIPGTETDFRIGPVFTEVSDEVAEHLRRTVPTMIEFLEKPRPQPDARPKVGDSASQEEDRESPRRVKRRQVED